jgi:hypothetical protein
MSRRLRRQLDALEARCRKLEGVEDKPSPALLRAYARYVDLITKHCGTTEWRTDENGELQPIESHDAAAKQDIKTT